MLGIGVGVSMAAADTPACSGSQTAGCVRTTPVSPGQPYPVVASNSEGWFDVGGFCKVVDVGDLSAQAPGAAGIPVFIPGQAAQWEGYRTLGPAKYNGQLALSTCCTPQSSIATICSAATNPQSVSRQYGKLGETDTVTANCITSSGSTYTEKMSLTCSGDNGPDGHATWSETSDAGTPPPHTDCAAQSFNGLGYMLNGEWCTFDLPASPAGFVTVTQAPTAANNWWGGSATNQCFYLPSRDKYVWSVPTGSCVQATCTGTPSWTVGGYTCTTNEIYGAFAQPVTEGAPALYTDPTGWMQWTPQTVILYDENLNTDGSFAPPNSSFVGGRAQATCNVDGTWSILPGATCGPGQCTPVGNPQVISPCTPNNTMVVEDSCGNQTVQFCVYVPPGPPSPPTFCASGTVISNCHYIHYPTCTTASGASYSPNLALGDCGGAGGSCPNSWVIDNTCTCPNGQAGINDFGAGPTEYVCN